MQGANKTIRTEQWMTGGGTVTNRTNIVINGLLDWAVKADVNKITRSNITQGVKELTTIATDDTADEYVERVTENGPFEWDAVGRWVIQWDQVDVLEGEE